MVVRLRSCLLSLDLLRRSTALVAFCNGTTDRNLTLEQKLWCVFCDLGSLFASFKLKKGGVALYEEF